MTGRGKGPCNVRGRPHPSLPQRPARPWRLPSSTAINHLSAAHAPATAMTHARRLNFNNPWGARVLYGPPDDQPPIHPMSSNPARPCHETTACPTSCGRPPAPRTRPELRGNRRRARHSRFNVARVPGAGDRQPVHELLEDRSFFRHQRFLEDVHPLRVSNGQHRGHLVKHIRVDCTTPMEAAATNGGGTQPRRGAATSSPPTAPRTTIPHPGQRQTDRHVTRSRSSRRAARRR